MPELEPGTVGDHPGLPDHVTTPLLTLITARSLDEDYAHVAQRRRVTGAETGPSPVRMRWATVAAVGVFGSLIAVAAVQTSRGAEVEELSRAALTEQITSKRAQLGEVQSAIAELSRSNQALATRVGSLTRQQDDMQPILERLEVRTGFTAVRGEGVRITLDSRPGADVDSELRDEDLATLVDALWEAGAEAIAVNDQRINVLGGIRNTNRAIHVNGDPLRAPYVVTVIGDNATLQARLQETSQGQSFQALANTLGFRYEVDNVDDVRLPAAALRPLRHVVATDTAPGGEESAP
jgi:uncharacterized protein YlxW (UPF0749 family)